MVDTMFNKTVFERIFRILKSILMVHSQLTVKDYCLSPAIACELFPPGDADFSHSGLD